MKNIDLSKLIVMDLRYVSHRFPQANDTRRFERRWCCSLVFRFNGSSTLECDGTTLMLDRSHVVFIPQYSKLTETCNETGEIYWFNFSASYLDDDYIKGYLEDNNLVTHKVNSSWARPTSFEINSTAELKSSCERIERYYVQHKPAMRSKCLAELNDLIYKIQVQMGAVASIYQRSQYEIVQPVVDYIEMNYSDQMLNNNKLAELAGVSEVYLRKLFSNLFGITPAKYVTNVRIEKAKSLLKTKIPVGEVAEEAGFSNIYHFSKTFKKITGCTPSEFARTGRL